MTDMEQLEKPYFYQVPAQNPVSGPLVLDKVNIAPGVAIVVSVVSATTQQGDTITVFFNEQKIGNPLLVKDSNELVYDLLITPDDWPEETSDAYVTVTRNGTVVAMSTSVSLQVINSGQAGDVQRREGFLLGAYSPGVVDSWLVPGSYSLVSGAAMPVSVLATGQNDDGATLELKRLKSAPAVDEILGELVYGKGRWIGSITKQVKLVRGDHLALCAKGTNLVNLALEFAI